MNLEELKEQLDKSELGLISCGYQEIDCLNSSTFDAEQIGYRIGQNGEDLLGDSEGGWKPEWYVIATENSDPYFIDLNSGRVFFCRAWRR